MKFLLTQILLFGFTLSLFSQTVTFTQASGSPIANAPNERSLMSRDINADGKKDLLVANLYANTLRVLLGNGSGQFTDAPGSPFSVVTGPNYIACADFNGDSHLDLATANYNSNNVTILLGTGTGSFVISSTISTGAYPYCIDVADFNLDGKVDLVTCNVNSNDIHILIGNGLGTFTVNGSPIAAGGMPYHVVTGNINADAFPDFAIANGQGNSVGVYFGNGSGGFGTPQMYSTGTQPRTITLKDLNADGYADMSIANALSDNITILMGSSAGTFTSASGSPISAGGSYPYQCAVADFDLDGKYDIATGNCFSNAMAVLLGNGNGTFNSASGNTLSIGSGPQPIIAEDFNGDTKPDIAVGYWYDNYLTILLNSSASPCNLMSSFSFTAGLSGLINFSNLSSGTTSATTYTWNYGDLTSSITFQAPHTYTNSGTYTVTLIASNNTTPACIDTATQVITINLPSPCNLITSFTYSALGGGQFQFNNTSTGTVTGTSYLWNYGDLTTSASFQATHNYLTSGIYTISLTANNNTNPQCVNTSTQSITVEVIKVGLAKEELTKKYLIYPNPSNGIINFENSNPKPNQEIVFYNILGEEKQRTTLQARSNIIALSSLEPGLYFYEIREDNKVLHTAQFILIN